jgi:hypothetical protein
MAVEERHTDKGRPEEYEIDWDAEQRIRLRYCFDAQIPSER